MNTIFNNHRIIRIGCAGIVSIFVALNGRWNLIHEAFVSPSFYFAVLVSFVIALFLLYIVHLGNTYLDKRITWTTHFYARLIYQFGLCFVLPSLIDIALVLLFFKATNSIFNVKDFLFYDYPVVGLLLLLLNCLYAIPHFFTSQHTPMDEDQTIHTSDTATSQPVLKINHSSGLIYLSVPDDLLYFCRIAKRVWVYAKDGTQYPIEDSLSHIHEQYHEAGIVQINRSTIVNIEIVKGYEKGLRRYTLDLTIHDAYKNNPAMNNNSFFVVTKEYISGFKAQMDLKYPDTMILNE